METTKEIVEREIEEYRTKFGDDGFFLNNFYFKLPDDKFKYGGYARDLYVENEEWDKSHLQAILESGSPEDVIDEDLKGHSGLYLKQTSSKFFDTIDTLLMEEGILEEVKNLQCLNHTTKFKWGNHHPIFRLYELVFPVYIKLREMGYTHKDLTN